MSDYERGTGDFTVSRCVVSRKLRRSAVKSEPRTSVLISCKFPLLSGITAAIDTNENRRATVSRVVYTLIAPKDCSADARVNLNHHISDISEESREREREGGSDELKGRESRFCINIDRKYFDAAYRVTPAGLTR